MVFENMLKIGMDRRRPGSNDLTSLVVSLLSLYLFLESWIIRANISLIKIM